MGLCKITKNCNKKPILIGKACDRGKEKWMEYSGVLFG
jgi:hypothetical protein